MRIILWLAAAAGVAAIATAAPARPGGGSGHGSGRPGAWAPGGGEGAGTGWRVRIRSGAARGRHGRHHRGRFGRDGRDGPVFFDGFAIAGPTGIIAPWGNGFFAGGGGEVRMRGNRPHYDYDRSYPYEWASAAGGRPDRDEAESASEPPPRCTLEKGVRVCRGW